LIVPLAMKTLTWITNSTHAAASGEAVVTCDVRHADVVDRPTAAWVSEPAEAGCLGIIGRAPRTEEPPEKFVGQTRSADDNR
jgi:hypothetical protein